MNQCFSDADLTESTLFYNSLKNSAKKMEAINFRTMEIRSIFIKSNDFSCPACYVNC